MYLFKTIVSDYIEAIDIEVNINNKARLGNIGTYHVVDVQYIDNSFEWISKRYKRRRAVQGQT